MKQKLLLIILLLLFLPLSGRAAILYLEPSSGSYYQGDTFIINLRIDSENECINTVEGNLSFPQDILQVVDFGQGNSILTLWISPPSFNQESGKISFIGGIPGGFCGRIPGDPGESNLLGKIIFKVKEIRGEQFSAEVSFSASSQVLLNDGLGTPAKLETRGAVFEIKEVRPLGGEVEPQKNEWQEELAKDTVSPEVFKIEIHQEPSIFEGKYFITFSTTDKQTGLDYYEVQEGDGGWRRAASPYLLEDQGLRSIIEVKAVDKAGNYLVVEQLPTQKPLSYKYFAIILVLMIGGIVWFIIRRFRRNP